MDELYFPQKLVTPQKLGQIWYRLPFSTLNLLPKMFQISKFHILSKYVSLHKSADLALSIKIIRKYLNHNISYSTFWFRRMSY